MSAYVTILTDQTTTRSLQPHESARSGKSYVACDEDAALPSSRCNADSNSADTFKCSRTRSISTSPHEGFGCGWSRMGGVSAQYRSSLGSW